LTPSPQIEEAGSQKSQRERAVYQIFSVVDQPIMEAEKPHHDEAYKQYGAIWLVGMASKDFFHGRLLWGQVRFRRSTWRGSPPL
jgi:hypothetical protein